MNYNKDNGLLNMIRTDPMIIIILNCVLIIGVYTLFYPKKCRRNRKNCRRYFDVQNELYR